MKNHTTAEEKILHLTPEQEKDKTHFTERDVCLGGHNHLVSSLIVGNYNVIITFVIHIILLYLSDWSRVGISRVSATFGMASQQLQNVWSYPRNNN